MNVLEFFKRTIMPPKCILCNRVMCFSVKTFVCEDCRSHLPFCSKSVCCTRCGKPIISFGEKQLCYDCMTKTLFRYHRIVSVFEYSGTVRRSILRYKNYGHRFYAGEFSNFLADRFFEEYNFKSFDFIISVPSDKIRKLRRGFDHSALLAKKLSEKINIPYLKNALRKTKHIPKQAMLNYQERIQNIKGSIGIVENVDIKNKRILLIDDVCTTRSTITECAYILKKNGAARVDVLTLATTVRHKAKTPVM